MTKPVGSKTKKKTKDVVLRDNEKQKKAQEIIEQEEKQDEQEVS
jgi:hypothetical protein